MPIYAQSSTLRNLTIPLVDVDQTTLQNEDLLQYNSTTGRFENQPLSSGGVSVITTASNVGAGDGVFKQKNIQDLEFKTITAGSGVVITANTDDIEISATAALDTASNLGGGEYIFSGKVGGDFQFRSLNEGAGNINFTVTTNADEIEFTNTAEINTASNLGAGTGLFAQKNTYDLEFKSLIAGDNVTITSDASTVTIAASAETNTSYSYQFGLTFDGNGDVDTITDIPSGWSITRVGNIVTIQHPVNRYPKSISYWGKDSVNGWQYRIPTAGYQATMDAGDELTEFKIDINATTSGADASSEAKVNVIF
jgi:hypothetical protein